MLVVLTVGMIPRNNAVRSAVFFLNQDSMGLHALSMLNSFFLWVFLPGSAVRFNCSFQGIIMPGITFGKEHVVSRAVCNDSSSVMLSRELRKVQWMKRPVGDPMQSA